MRWTNCSAEVQLSTFLMLVFGYKVPVIWILLTSNDPQSWNFVFSVASTQCVFFLMWFLFIMKFGFLSKMVHLSIKYQMNSVQASITVTWDAVQSCVHACHKFTGTHRQWSHTNSLRGTFLHYSQVWLQLKWFQLSSKFWSTCPLLWTTEAALNRVCSLLWFQSQDLTFSFSSSSFFYPPLPLALLD